MTLDVKVGYVLSVGVWMTLDVEGLAQCDDR